ncbi:hypothetical protein GDO78_021526 [Eleutherodactylus coqui]|uniref:Uncharacterized protein n=1 Tax=Eleutherodactylus coqui TaxID=57060 RepID=A0A8J6JUM9_ELECQ|nr:hypothetical protein GDO78_021526 [Eleutherodactylus coqui]
MQLPVNLREEQQKVEVPAKVICNSPLMWHCSSLHTVTVRSQRFYTFTSLSCPLSRLPSSWSLRVRLKSESMDVKFPAVSCRGEALQHQGHIQYMLQRFKLLSSSFINAKS